MSVRRISSSAAPTLASAMGGLQTLDVSGNALGAGGAAVLLLAQQAAAAGGGGCRVAMEDVCVRPDAPILALLDRAAAGEVIPQSELDASKVHAAAAPVLEAAAAAAPPPPKPKSKPGAPKRPAKGLNKAPAGNSNRAMGLRDGTSRGKPTPGAGGKKPADAKLDDLDWVRPDVRAPVPPHGE